MATPTDALYMPPFKRRLSQVHTEDKSTNEYQNIAWQAIKKRINGLLNRVNTANVVSIAEELLKDNIVRGDRLLVSGVLQAQIASPSYTSVYAALISVMNPHFPQIGELIGKQLLSSFRRTYKQNDKVNYLATTKFIAHLVNQNVLHEIVVLEILILLLEDSTNDSVQLAIGLLNECGEKLSQVNPRGLNSIFLTLIKLSEKSSLDKCTRDMIEALSAAREDQFKENPAIPTGLHLIKDYYQYTHMLTLVACEPELLLADEFQYDDNYEKNEEKYKVISESILRENDSSSSDGDENKDIDDEVKKEKQQTMNDEIETKLVTLRQTIDAAIETNVDPVTCACQLLEEDLNPEQEMVLCRMIIECCAVVPTYKRFFGSLVQELCSFRNSYVGYFEKLFQVLYEVIHTLGADQLINVAKFFAHLLTANVISWGVLRCIHITDEEKPARVYIMKLLIEVLESLDPVN